MDRRCCSAEQEITPVEYQFKSAVLGNNDEAIRRLAASGSIVGESALKFLQEVDRSDIAVHFVRDPAVRFSLAVKLFDVELAFESAEQLNTPAHWDKVAEMALLAGRLGMVETAYQRARNFSRLKFLYVITGEYTKLEKLGRIFGVRREMSNQLEVALVLGDVEEQVDLLNRSGNQVLAELVDNRFNGTSTNSGENWSVSGIENVE